MKLTLSSSPHLRANLTTRKIMLEVILALLPATFAAVYFFRYRAAFLILTCVVTAALTEEFILRVRSKTAIKPGKFMFARDFSAPLTGLLLALILPPGTTWYAAVISSLFAISVGKHIFGGLGANIFNPALLGRALLVATYPQMMTTFSLPFEVDTISEATPLALAKFNGAIVPLKDLFLGAIPGSIGETSAICLLIGGIYLLLRRIADWRIPVTIISVVVVISGLAYYLDNTRGAPLFHILSGGMLLGVLFMATDPVTTPVTKLGRYIFGIGCAGLIMLIRYFSGLPEGVMYSILFMNAVTPLINRYARPRRYGYNL